MKKIVFITLIFLLFYTRFVNLGWGLPYPMHPDERNMAVAVQQLNCDELRTTNYELKNCLNPHFFAYGQLPLYLAYGGVQVYHFITGQLGQITFLEATLALRTISSLSSILLVFVLLKIIELVLNPKKRLYDFKTLRLLTLIFLIFQPYMIQFSHFGTTESLLMLLYSLIIYYSLRFLMTTHYELRTIVLLGLFSGLALGTKTSSILFLGVPLLILIIKVIYSFFAIGGADGGAPRHTRTLDLRGSIGGEEGRGRIYREVLNIFFYLLISSLFFILSSPQSLLNWTDFIGSMQYESAVGLGTYVAFYTRQFVGTKPLLFQFEHILPYVLGWPQLILAVLGLIFLPWFKQKSTENIMESNSKLYANARDICASTRRHRWHMQESLEGVLINPYNILRLSLLLSFLPPSFFFAKWTRFISPSFPLFSLFAMLFFIHLFEKVQSSKFQVLKYVLFFIIISPGIAFLSIYTSPDVRFTASDWIYKNIPANSKILTETANVIDLPVPPPDYAQRTRNYALNSFNFYDLGESIELQTALSDALKQADYIIVPSRRVFANHTCLSPKSSVQSLESRVQSSYCGDFNYPLLHEYYSDLFSGSLGFEQVAEFSSFPRFEFSILDSTFRVPFKDEDAEETWTVFDHPVIRIYKRGPKSESPKVLKSQIQPKKTDLDFSDYKITDFRLSTFDVRLLVADTPSKWERGLMHVRSKKDIGGADGMIFIFPDSQKRTFWNKNTLSNLALYWINSNKVIGTSDLPSITESGEITTASSPIEVNTVVEILK